MKIGIKTRFVALNTEDDFTARCFDTLYLSRTNRPQANIVMSSGRWCRTVWSTL